MGIRVEHTVHKLPETYVTYENVYKYVPSEDDPKVKVRVEEKVEHRGGYLVKFMRGHSIRCFDEAHLKRLGFTEKPRLIDEVSGQECNEQGVPLDIAHLVAPNHDGSNEEFPDMGVETSDDPVESIIKETA